jgi:type II secretory pathway pseudopilin PulG
MEGSATVLVVIAILGAGAAVVTVVVQEILRASGISVTRGRLEGVLEAMEAVVYDTPRPSGSIAAGPWGERGPHSVEEARAGLLQTLAETPIDHLAADASTWRRVQRMLTLSRTGPPPPETDGRGEPPRRPAGPPPG